MSADAVAFLRPRILIVDDQVANLVALRQLLSRVNAEVMEASSGETALALCMEHDFALLLLDVRMPGMDGFEVLEYIHGTGRNRHVPVLFLTAAHTDERHRLKGYQAGAVDFIQKPLDDRILLSKVAVFLELFHQRQQLEEKNRLLEMEIAQRKQVEEILRESEERFRSVTQSASDAIISIDQEDCIIFWNQGASRLFGYEVEEIQGQPLTCLIPEQLRAAHLAALRHVRENGTLRLADQVVTLTALHRDGREIPVELSLASWHSRGSTFFSAVIRDITDRKKAEEEQQRLGEELTRTMMAAESANEAKSGFLASMSHEIRTPLNTIVGMCDILADANLKKEERGFVLIMQRASQALLTLVNDILDFSKIEAGQMVLEKVPFDLADLVWGTTEILRFAAEDKGLALTCDLDQGLPALVTGDPERLRQILLNLLGNAVKFTDRGRIVIRVSPGQDDRVHIRVADSGVGIPLEKQETIFQPFTQAESFTSRRFGGSGLGLTICQRLTTAMGGHIRVNSEVGKGSIFHVLLPLPATTQVEIPPKQALRQGQRETAMPGELATIGLAILLADDAMDNHLLIQAFLKHTPHRLQMAANGEECFQIFQEGKFDLVLMDMQMPVMDGFTATRAIRAWESATGAIPTPIVALTAHAMKEDTQKTREAGCDLHLTKPITKKRLLQALNDFIPATQEKR